MTHWASNRHRSDVTSPSRTLAEIWSGALNRSSFQPLPTDTELWFVVSRWQEEKQEKNAANQSANSWPITEETTGSVSGVKHFPAAGSRKVGSDKQKRLYCDLKKKTKNIKNWSHQRDGCAVSRAIRRPPRGFPASKRRSWRTCHFHWAEKKKKSFEVASGVLIISWMVW